MNSELLGLLQHEPSQAEQKQLETIWERQPFFHPSCRYLGFKPTSRAIRERDTGFFARQIRNSFFPDQSDESVRENVRLAMNRGISAVNSLCAEHLGPDAEHFLLSEAPLFLNLFNFLSQAREDWINARSGRHAGKMVKRVTDAPTRRPDAIDYELLSKAYESVRAFGLGYRVLMIDESPEVLTSIRQYRLLSDWLARCFQFKEPQPVSHPDFSHSFKTSAGVRVYGTIGQPIRSRVKVLNRRGEIRYGSLLMKMITKMRHLSEIKDYEGVEFVVADAQARDQLLHWIRTEVRTMERLEGFRSGRADSRTSSPQTSDNFNVTKFILRPPVPVPAISNHPLGRELYERVPVEVQILTLQAHEARRTHPDAKHEQYKRRQFLETFPVLFPRDIYLPLLRSRGVIE